MPFWWYPDTKVRKLVLLLQRYFASTLREQPNVPHRGFASTKGSLHWLLVDYDIGRITVNTSLDQENEDVKRLRSQGKSKEELKLMGSRTLRCPHPHLQLHEHTSRS
jgi:hypothetical protein